MIGRRSLLGGLLLAPAIVRTPGLLMAVSVQPSLLLRLYGYDANGMLELQDAIRMDDFDFAAGECRGPHVMARAAQVWRATVETTRHDKRIDGKEIPLNAGPPRHLAPGDLLHLSNLDLVAYG